MALSLGKCCCRTRNTFKKLSHCRIHRFIHWSAACFQQDTTVSHQDKIVLPLRIKRGPTDILKALSETNEKDMTAPDFMYVDDPYLIPYSPNHRRKFMLARMSGKHAARHIVENYPQFFSENPSVPNIEAYSKMGLGKVNFVNKPDTVEGLNERIRAREAVEAYVSFQQVDKSEIPLETFNQLIDLLCVNNSKDPEKVFTAEEICIMDEDNGNQHNQEPKEIPREKWRNNAPATIVFEMMPTKNSWAYSSMIKGMVRFNKHAVAYELFQQMKAHEMKIDVYTYNEIFSILYECVDNYWKQAMELLQNMEKSGVKPNVATFNSILRTLATHFGDKVKKDCSIKVINEMQSLGIEPSLASWHYLLQCHYPRKGNRSEWDSNVRDLGLLTEIIAYVDGKTFHMRDKDDDKFFHTAMSNLFFYNKNVKLANNVFSLGLKHENLLGGQFIRNDFCYFYLQILCGKKKVDIAMEELRKLVPNFYMLRINLIKPLLRVIEALGKMHYIPELWSLCKYGQLHQYPDVSLLFMNVVSGKKYPPELQEKFVAMARETYSAIKEGHTRSSRSVASTHNLIVELVKVMMHGEEFLLMWEMFDEYSKEAEKGLIFPQEVFLQLGKICINHGDFDKLKELFTLFSSLGYVKIGRQILEEANEVDLRREQKEMLDNLLN